MKFNYLKNLFTALLLLCATAVSAHDFEVDCIYYRVTNESVKEVAVSFYGNAFDEIDDEYIGYVVIPSNVIYNNTHYTVTSIDSEAFWGCSSVTGISIPNSISSIDGSAFKDCNKIKKVELDCNTIGAWFNGITSITDVVLGSNVHTIGSSAFKDCTSLENLKVSDKTETIYSDAFENTLWAANQPDGLLIINNCLFGSTNVVSGKIVIPDNVTVIGTTGIWVGTATQGVFQGNNNITDVIIHDKVTAIGGNAFYGCSSITDIVIPNSVTTIGDGAFYKCSSLKSVKISDNVKYLGGGFSYGVFESCASLENVVIPNSVEYLGGIFYGCIGLKSVTLGSGVRHINSEIFNSCKSLSSIISYIPADSLVVPSGFYEHIRYFNLYGVDVENCTLYVPHGATEKYASTDGWSVFKNIVELPGDFELVVSNAGYATLYLDYAVKIPEGIEAYIAKDFEGEILKMENVSDVLPANTAVVVKANPGNYIFEEINDNDIPQITGNLLKGTVKKTFINSNNDTEYYVLSIVDGEVGMYRALLSNNRFINNANKAYLPLNRKGLGIYDNEEFDTSAGGQLSNGFRFDFGGTTVIDDVENENVTVKTVYDLFGRAVENPTNGIYIIDGKKVLVK